MASRSKNASKPKKPAGSARRKGADSEAGMSGFVKLFLLLIIASLTYLAFQLPLGGRTAVQHVTHWWQQRQAPNKPKATVANGVDKKKQAPTKAVKKPEIAHAPVSTKPPEPVETPPPKPTIARAPPVATPAATPPKASPPTTPPSPTIAAQKPTQPAAKPVVAPTKQAAVAHPAPTMTSAAQPTPAAPSRPPATPPPATATEQLSKADRQAVDKLVR